MIRLMTSEKEGKEYIANAPVVRIITQSTTMLDVVIRTFLTISEQKSIYYIDEVV